MNRTVLREQNTKELNYMTSAEYCTLGGVALALHFSMTRKLYCVQVPDTGPQRHAASLQSFLHTSKWSVELRAGDSDRWKEKHHTLQRPKSCTCRNRPTNLPALWEPVSKGYFLSLDNHQVFWSAFLVSKPCLPLCSNSHMQISLTLCLSSF